MDKRVIGKKKLIYSTCQLIKEGKKQEEIYENIYRRIKESGDGSYPHHPHQTKPNQ